MAWFVFFAVVLLVPIGLLVWRRRDSGPGAGGTDPRGHRNTGSAGGPPPQGDGWGGADGNL